MIENIDYGTLGEFSKFKYVMKVRLDNYIIHVTECSFIGGIFDICSKMTEELQILNTSDRRYIKIFCELHL